VKERAQRFLPVFVIVFLGIVCYSNALRNGFVWDDKSEILGNRFLRSWEFLPRLFTTDLREAYGSEGEPTPLYRPLRTVLHLIDFQMWGPNPFGFHLTNVILHVANGLLVFSLLRTLRIQSLMALLFATLFICHPLQTEAVTYISSRGTGLCTLFMLTSLLVLLKSFTIDSERRSCWLLVISAGVFWLALLSKEMALALPVTLAAAGWLTAAARRIPKKWLVVAIVWYAAILAVNFAVRLIVLSIQGHPPLGSLGFRALSALRTLAVSLDCLWRPSIFTWNVRFQ